MEHLVVVERPSELQLKLPGTQVVSAWEYLTERSFDTRRAVRVFNLCSTFRYQGTGYYVSLLAAARGHKPAPAVTTLQELRSPNSVRARCSQLDALVQRSLRPIQSDRFTLSVYFGRNLARRHEALSQRLFQLFYAPLLRADFARSRHGRWTLKTLGILSAVQVPPEHLEFVEEAAARFLAPGKRATRARVRSVQYDMAVLVDPDEVEPPSNQRALARFARAAHQVGIGATQITNNDYPRLAAFDALFIRETTAVQHATFRFARRARAEGMVVVDDPDSILRCTNKVYLAELMRRYRVPVPRTVVAHRENLAALGEQLGFPLVLKQPDGAFSRGVERVSNPSELDDAASRLLARSELIIAQEFLPTEFDWRIGVFDGEPLYACQYFMAPRHWQIVKCGRDGKRRTGRSTAYHLDEVPEPVVRTALRAAKLLGRGLYGVDLKQVGRRVVVVEVNDNPSIDAGVEDGVAGDDLYLNIMRVFRQRLDARRQTGAEA